MLLEPLVSLREGVVVDVARLVVAIAAEVRLRALGLFNLDIDALDLVVLHTHLDRELVGHNESIRLD